MVVMERNDAIAAERDDPGVSADRRLVPLEIKVTFAFTNAPQAQYLMHYTTIDAWSDGSDTLAGIKQKFSDKEGVPVEFIKFMWLDEPIGRCARVRAERRSRALFPPPGFFFLGRNRLVGSPRSRPTRARRIYMGKVPKQARITEAKTMKELNIFGPDTWLDKFPHWRCLCATIAEEEKRDALEEVHRAVATQIKGYEEGPELDRHIQHKRKTKKWNTLVFGAPTPYDSRYPETMPKTGDDRYTNCFDDDWDKDPEEEAEKLRTKSQPQLVVKKAPAAADNVSVQAAAPEVEEEPKMSLEEVVTNVSRLSSKMMGTKELDVDAPLMESGLDSLTSVELINELSSAFGVQLSATTPYDYPTVKELSKHIVEKL